MVKTWRFHCWGLGLIPGQGTKIPQAAWRGQKKRKKKKKKNIYIYVLCSILNKPKPHQHAASYKPLAHHAHPSHIVTVTPSEQLLHMRDSGQVCLVKAPSLPRSPILLPTPPVGQRAAHFSFHIQELRKESHSHTYIFSANAPSLLQDFSFPLGSHSPLPGGLASPLGTLKLRS